MAEAQIDRAMGARGSGDVADTRGLRGDDGTEAAGSPPAAVATNEPGSQDDPLQGEWRAEFTCEDSLRAIEGSGLSPDQIRVQVLRDSCCPTGSLHSFMGGWFGGRPTKDDPCRGATKSRSIEVRFEDGTLELGDPDVVGVEYELLDDHTIGVTDPSDNVCPLASNAGGSSSSPAISWRSTWARTSAGS